MVQSKLVAEPRWVTRTSDLRPWVSPLIVLAGVGVVLLVGFAVPVTRPEPAGLLGRAFLWPLGVASLLAVIYRGPLSALARRLADRSPRRHPRRERAPRPVPG